MTNNILTKLESFTKKDQIIFNTACLKVNTEIDFNEAYKELIELTKQTVEEEGCIEFFVAPGSIENKEIILWEVWVNKKALAEHMEKDYTQTLLEKNLFTLKWQLLEQLPE